MKSSIENTRKYKNENIERNGIYKGPLEGRRRKNELQGGDF